MNYDMDMVQINDALTQTGACASTVAYDKANGLVFVSYMTGIIKYYGENAGKICLSVFSPSQPHNIRHRIIDEMPGKSRGFLCNGNYLIGDGILRVFYTTNRGELAAYYKDYDFFNDTVSERTEVFLRNDNKDVRLDKNGYIEFLASKGYVVESQGKYTSPIINKITRYNGELYTSISMDALGYAILCKIEDNVLVPFAIHPEAMTYEFRYFINNEGIFGVYRVPPDDHKTAHAAYTVSTDGGKNWSTQIFQDGVQSRPDIIEYYGKPLIVYNYKANKSIENFPCMHNFRNAIKIIYNEKIIFDWFSKYGIVEYDTVNICGDIYMAFSNCPQALSTENEAAWIEDGRPVEQGKEAIQWTKLGYLLK